MQKRQNSSRLQTNKKNPIFFLNTHPNINLKNPSQEVRLGFFLIFIYLFIYI
jgi:hypothetical protein